MNGEKLIYSFDNGTFSADYIRFGNGDKPLVILPGLSLKPVTDSAKEIKAAYSCFCKTHTLYFITCRKDLKDGFTVSDMASDVAVILNSLGIKDADVLGVSFGGMTAQCLAAEYPALAGKLVLASTYSRPDKKAISVFEKWISLANVNTLRKFNRSVYTSVYSERYYTEYKDIFSVAENYGTAAELEKFVIGAKACMTFNMYSSLKKIKCPVLVIGDKRDKIMSQSLFTEIAEELGCPIFVYDGYSHAVYDEAPDFKEKLLDFFGCPA